MVDVVHQRVVWHPQCLMLGMMRNGALRAIGGCHGSGCCERVAGRLVLGGWTWWRSEVGRLGLVDERDCWWYVT